MQEKFVAKASVSINRSAKKIWEYLTTPELIKQYLFGTEVVSDWKVGSPIIYKGVWEGKPYEDKGVIQKFEPEKLLVCTYWSSFSGLPDAPENYQLVSYELLPSKNKTILTVTGLLHPTT